MNVAKLPAAANFNWRIKHFLKRKLDQGRSNNELPANPIHPKEAAKAILNATQPYIFFDIFDTLVQRTVNPEHSKIIACQHLASMAGLHGIDGPALYEIRQDLEARLCLLQHAQNEELEFTLQALSEQMYVSLDANDRLPPDCTFEDFRDLLFHCEILAEKSVLAPVKPTISALKQASAEGKKCILVSDFYLPAPLIRKMLAPFDILDHIDALFVSCDEMASKRSGRLYDIVLERLNIGAKSALMVGDNIWSDINNARDYGISTLYLADPTQKSFYSSNEADVTDAKLFKTRCDAIFATPSPHEKADFKSLAAPLLLFTERLYQALRQNNQRNVFFLAREGQILEKLFNRYQDALDVPGKFRIKTHYLIASRRATYIASLQPLEREDFGKLFWQYRALSLADFLQSLRFPEAEISKLAESLGIDHNLTIEEFPESPVFKALIKNKIFATCYENLRTEQQENLHKYLKGFEVDFSKHPLTLVDVGWKGSIQDNIRKALPKEIGIEGYYLGLIAPGDDAQHKKGLLFSNQMQTISPYFTIFAENRSLFEIALPADHSSALNYVKRSDGSIDVELDIHEEESTLISNTIMPIVSDIMDAFDELLEVRMRHVLKSIELEGIIASIHSKTVFSPTPAQLHWTTQISHRENFGKFANSYFGSMRKHGAFARLGYITALLRKPREEIFASFWPYHTLHTKGGAPVAAVYRWFRLGQLRWRLKKQADPTEKL